MSLEVEVRVHTSVAECSFCRAETGGSTQQLERVVQQVNDTRRADTCSYHGQVIAAMVQDSGGTVRWVTGEGE